MKGRRTFGIVLGGIMLAGMLAPAGADEHGYPIIEEPVLREDTKWERTEWGFKHEDLAFPDGQDWKWPTIMRTQGYEGATRPYPNAYLRMDDGALMALRIDFGEGPRGDYAGVRASVRGTECSGGKYFLYDRRHAWDGHHIIEWIASQPWSNGRVGMSGGSYGGQTPYWIAATQPPSLATVMSSLLHADIYRDIFMPGGIQNYLFPVAWYLTGPNRLPRASINNETIPNDEICTQNQATRSSAGEPPNPHRDYIWLAAEPTDNDFYQAHAATSYAHLIKVPYYQQHNWHDEQTGPRAVVLWHYINPDPRTIIGSDGLEREVIPKRFALSNGSHNFGGTHAREVWDWLDIWLLDMPDVKGLLDEPVTNFFDIRRDGTHAARKGADVWPFPDTDWTRLHLADDRSLDWDAPAAAGADTYLSGAKTRNWSRSFAVNEEVTTARNLPDAVVYESAPLEEDLAIAGPILMELHASLATTDTDFFVSLHEVWPDGTMSYLQRGLLKASHRRVDRLRSWYNADGELIQPFRPHTNPTPVVPGAVERYDIEIWPLGHIFRAGNSIRIQIHTPPALDNIWGYTAHQHQPGAVTVHWGGETPSNLFLPVVSDLTPGTAVPVADCRVPGGFACAQISDY